MSDSAASIHEERAKQTFDSAVAELRKCAAETPQEFTRRWPYNWKVSIDSNQARAILEVLDARS